MTKGNVIYLFILFIYLFFGGGRGELNKTI